MSEPEQLLSDSAKQRQILYWRLLAAAFELDDLAPSFRQITEEIVQQAELPISILDTKTGVDTLLNRHPELRAVFDELPEILQQPEDEEENEEEEGEEVPADDSGEAAVVEPQEAEPSAEASPIDRPATIPGTLAYSKLVLNVFGPNTRSPKCTAQQYQQWQQDVARFEACFGFAPGTLRAGGGQSTGGGGGGPGTGTGGGPRVDDAQLREELLALESDIIQRMDLREVLADDRLAAQVPATLPVIEQLLYDKSNLSGTALANARKLIRKYVDELAEVLKKQVAQTSVGEIDRSVPPKRVFRNLDMKRTLWQNLPTYNPEDGKLYVDRLYYRHSSKKTIMNYFVVVVDQSGSMVDAMVQCAILASIFAALPNIQVTLLAFDTAVINLTPWVHDPFEALMRTNLGGGTDGPVAMREARELLIDPRKTTMVWISDFFDRRELLDMIKAVREAGVHFIPVGSVSSSGYFSVDDWFRKQLKQTGCPVLTGNIRKLIIELKKQLK